MVQEFCLGCVLISSNGKYGFGLGMSRKKGGYGDFYRTGIRIILALVQPLASCCICGVLGLIVALLLAFVMSLVIEDSIN
jgi:hypothetical protein